MFPANLNVKEILENNNSFKDGNFSLWYNKYIPIDNENFKPIKPENNDEERKENIKYYKEKYDNLIRTSEIIKNSLKNKHLNQIKSLLAFKDIYINNEIITLQAETQTPFVLGIGESHPSETSIVFDHLLGIPYIPSSSIKGCVRLAYILSLIFDNDGEVNENILKKINNQESNVIEFKELESLFDIFGGQNKEDNKIKSHKGDVIFMDAYPLNIPELKTDIMNPHYPDYYKDGKTPPADWQIPTPIKFLTVKEKSKFIFRFLVPNKFKKDLKTAIKKAIEDEGIGAKTAIGYGRFKITEWEEPNDLKTLLEKEEEEMKKKEIEKLKMLEEEKLKKMSPDEKMIYKIEKFEFDNPEDINERGNKVKSLVGECLNDNYSKNVYIKLKEKLVKIKEWNPSKDFKGNKIKNKKRKEARKKRNEQIEKKIRGEA